MSLLRYEETVTDYDVPPEFNGLRIETYESLAADTRMHMHKQRFAVLAFPTLRTFVVYADTVEDACALVQHYFDVHEPRYASSGLTATPAGSWDLVGFGDDGTPWYDLLGDALPPPTLYEGKRTTGA